MIDLSLKGKVALVTGGNGGLGLEIAKALAENGADIAIVARNEGKSAKARDEIEKLTGRRVLAYQCDLRDISGIPGTVESVKRDFGKIDILVNNAGVVSARIKGPEEQTEAEWDKVMDTDLKAPYFMATEVFKQSMREHGGKIINMASTGGVRILPNPISPSYNISKAGLIMMTQVLAVAWAKYGVNVNAMSPGMMSGGMGGSLPPEVEAHFNERIPQRRCGTVEDLRGVAVFLASDANTYCQGVNIPVDGGFLLPLD